MAALRQSLVTLHPKFTAGTTSPISSSSLLRPIPRPLLRRRRLPALKISLPATIRRRRPAGGAAGAVMVDTAASRYATALADVALANGTLEATVCDVEKIDRVFSDPSVQSFFANPTIPAEKKGEVVAEIAKAEDLKPHTANFLNILVDTNRIIVVKEIVKEFEDCYNKITGTEVAVVSSVVKLESQHLVQIAQTVQRFTKAKNVRIKTVIDPSLVAGFTIRYGSSGSKLIDMSVKKQLNEIASQIDFSSITLS